MIYLFSYVKLSYVMFSSGSKLVPNCMTRDFKGTDCLYLAPRLAKTLLFALKPFQSYKYKDIELRFLN